MVSMQITPGCSSTKRLDDGTTGVVKFGRCLPRIPGQFCTLINIMGLLINVQSYGQGANDSFDGVFEPTASGRDLPAAQPTPTAGTAAMLTDEQKR
jgi:hypothetical protein